jgi:hypothetical protein
MATDARGYRFRLEIDHMCDTRSTQSVRTVLRGDSVSKVRLENNRLKSHACAL